MPLSAFGVFVGLFSSAFAQEICEEPDKSNFLDGEHFWIQWDEDVGTEESASEFLTYAEEARSFYIDELDWPFTDQSILMTVESTSFSGGLAQTLACGDNIVPSITLYATAVGKPGLITTKHEVAHAAQYAYMGDYLSSVNSWTWWMEGCASWMATHASDDASDWAVDVSAYLERPWLPLHQTVAAYIDDDRVGHMYGTAVLAQFIEDNYGIDTVRQTWEVGAAYSGETIDFRDIITELGIDWEDFWRQYMATMTVVDVTHADTLASGLPAEREVTSFPASGNPAEHSRPRGLGLSGVHFGANALGKGTLTVTFEGDPAVEWYAQLVVVVGPSLQGEVVEILPIELVDGAGEIALEVDGKHTEHMWLIASPQSVEDEGYDYAWSADLPQKDEEKGGCGCSSTLVPVSSGTLLLLAPLWWRRRRVAA